MSLTISTSLSSREFLDHYRLRGLVASGGMASVYQAIDTKTGSSVAIKIPHPEVASDPLVLGRLRCAAQISRKLDHPGLVKVLHGDGSGDRYVVMEWLEGEPLRQIIDREGKLPTTRAIGITLSVCDALQYLHSRGILHRDIKPENVMVDAADNIKIIDLGIADESKGILRTRARLEDTMGTPDYVSPEQIKGKRGDARSDIYSLGITLFEMLTGEVPFSGLDANAAMQLRVLVDPPGLCEINPDLSPSVQDVVNRAVSRHRKHRYATVREFAAELSKLVTAAAADRPLELLVRS
jgi:eukaryotic-like serine/threonine-protein kinase